MISVLHVDDAAEDAELLRLKLSKFSEDIKLMWSSSAQEALARIREYSFDCILCDYQMPGMNGLQLLKRLRTEGADMPFIFFTGQGNERLAEEAFNNGADDYYTKDAGFAHYDRLVHSIRRIVDGHRAVRLRARSERALRAILNGTATETANTFFRSLVLNLTRAADVRYSIIGRKFGDEIRTIAFAADGIVERNFRYNYLHAPCHEAMSLELFYVADSLRERFPNESWLNEMNIESYCGSSLSDSDGEPLGVLALLHDKPFTDKQFILSMMRIFASRASVELEREIVLENLMESERQYRDIFNTMDDAAALHDQLTMAVLDVNMAFLRLTGYSYEEALTTNTAFKHFSFTEKTEEALREGFDSLNENEQSQLDWILVTKNGEHLKTELTLKRVISENRDRVLTIFRPKL